MTDRSAWLEDLRRRMVVLPVMNDPRSAGGLPLGKDARWVYQHAIGGGQADFAAPIGDLTADERALLYAFFNQQGHVDELVHAFRALLLPPERFHRATVVDIGCGPFTAGLALADVLGPAQAWRYVGVDRAPSMLVLGQALAGEVRRLGRLHADSTVAFGTDLDAMPFGALRGGEPTLFVLSYLLASNTLDVADLAARIARNRPRIGHGPTLVLYTNSAKPGPRRQFPAFRAHLEAAGFTLEQEGEESFAGSDRPRDLHYALFTLPATASLPLAAFQP